MLSLTAKEAELSSLCVSQELQVESLLAAHTHLLAPPDGSFLAEVAGRDSDRSLCEVVREP